MAHYLSRWLVLAAVAMVGVVALLIQGHGWSDSGRSAAERDGDMVDLRRVTVDLGDGVTMEFVLIPAGRFLMGSPKEEKERCEDEGPQHEVTISRSF
jgi:formylglycine-generating enzyme required for sulfatase activity